MYKKLYDAMLESEELEILFPNATKDWTKDEKEFIRLCELNNEIDEEQDEEIESYL